MVKLRHLTNLVGKNSYYVHSAVKDKIGKIISVVKTSKESDTGKKVAMHVSALSPMAIEEKDLNKDVVKKEMEIIKAELLNSGKSHDIIEKIAKGKINKFISDNTLLTQAWVMEPKKKVSDILKDSDIKIIDFVRYKVGEDIKPKVTSSFIRISPKKSNRLDLSYKKDLYKVVDWSFISRRKNKPPYDKSVII